LLDNENIKIAIVKNIAVNIEYKESHKELNVNNNLTALKDKIKNEKDENKREILKNHLKELKRNFIFVSASQLKTMQTVRKVKNEEGVVQHILLPEGFQFYINKNNAMIQYTFTDKSGNETVSNIVLPPDLLMKWVISHIFKPEHSVTNDITKFIIEHINKFRQVNSEELLEFYSNKYTGINPKKLLPISIRQPHKLNKPNEVTKYLRIKTTNNIDEQIKKLENFIKENQQKPKPWKYASKRKIDIIIHYLHYKLLYDVYINKIDLLILHFPTVSIVLNERRVISM
jgi:hypothetical protein